MHYQITFYFSPRKDSNKSNSVLLTQDYILISGVYLVTLI